MTMFCKDTIFFVTKVKKELICYSSISSHISRSDMHLDMSLLTLKRIDWDSVCGSKSSNEICHSLKHLKPCT